MLDGLRAIDLRSEVVIFAHAERYPQLGERGLLERFGDLDAGGVEFARGATQPACARSSAR